MKTPLFVFFSLFVLSAMTQNHTTINIITKKLPGTFVSLFLDDKPIGALKENENLEFRIYSEGRMTLKFTSQSVWDKSSELIEVINGKNLYFQIKSWDLGSKLKIEHLGRSDWEKIFKTCINNIKTEEDISNPIGKLPKGFESEGPKQGTCFLISKKGYLLTNYHVISGAKTIQIKGINSDFTTLYAADVVAFDINLDLALLKLKNQNLNFDSVPYSLSSETNSQGTKSFVLGFPMTSAMGEEIKVTEGIISAKSGYKGTNSQYQFSAAVQPGNSGSPLFNDNGDVIGVINEKLQGAEATGYAIKSQHVSTFLKLVENIQIEHNKTNIMNLSLADKIAKLKSFIFIVKCE